MPPAEKPSASGLSVHTTQSFPAYRPETPGLTRSWLLVVAGLVAIALVALAVRPVCVPDEVASAHAGIGVRHEQRGTTWFHCEPWARRAFAD